MITLMAKRREQGFTLIETMIVLAIAAVLLVIVFLAVPQLRNGQQRRTAINNLNTIISTIRLARVSSGKYLKEITLSGYSGGPCYQIGINDPQCSANWSNALIRISNTALSDLSYLDKDPWGNPFIMDENEREFGASDCRLDYVRSAGQDAIINTSDDISKNIPLFRTCP